MLLRLMQYVYINIYKKWFPDKIPPTKIPPKKKNWLRFSVATLFGSVARFARVRIEDSSRNRLALNGIQRIACIIVFSS